MIFTALHRALGRPPGPLTDELLDAAVAAGAQETDDLDWKRELPPAKSAPQSDFPKDVAAMANSGGGVIVYGVEESEKAATGRVDVGLFDEKHERSLRSAAITAITPPVFGLDVVRLGGEGRRAVAVVVPASVDGPHLIYKQDYFAAPVRNDADTVWMKERQIEAMYRARFDERRHAAEAIGRLFDEAAAGRDTGERAWFVAVGRPRIPRAGVERPSRFHARTVFVEARQLGFELAPGSEVHPLYHVDVLNPRPGLRRWVAVNVATTEATRSAQAWASMHHDGSVTLAAAVGGRPLPRRNGSFEGRQVESTALEAAVADFMALVRVTGQATGSSEYDVRVGLEWTGAGPLALLTVSALGHVYDDGALSVHRFTPVASTVNAGAAEGEFFRQVHDLAQDCVHQGGIAQVQLIRPPLQEAGA